MFLRVKVSEYSKIVDLMFSRFYRPACWFLQGVDAEMYDCRWFDLNLEPSLRSGKVKTWQVRSTASYEWALATLPLDWSGGGRMGEGHRCAFRYFLNATNRQTHTYKMQIFTRSMGADANIELTARLQLRTWLAEAALLEGHNINILRYLHVTFGLIIQWTSAVGRK